LLTIFRAYTLYLTESRLEGRSWYSLRLGFFRDAISAKQVASYVRSDFSSVAVVPITEEEHVRSSETRIDTTTVTATFGQQFDRALEADRGREAAAAAKGSAAARSAQKQVVNSPPSAAASKPAVPPSAPASKPAVQRPSSKDRASTPSRNTGRAETLEQTLELLASSEIWDNGDSPTDTGVRHLSVEVQRRSSGR